MAAHNFSLSHAFSAPPLTLAASCKQHKAQTASARAPPDGALTRDGFIAAGDRAQQGDDGAARASEEERKAAHRAPHPQADNLAFGFGKLLRVG